MLGTLWVGKMHEKCKLEEARHFLRRMIAEAPDRKVFRFELSAFLGSARSVLQYALEEAKRKPGGQAWYEQQVNARPVLAFFKDKRDLNIHVQPIDVSKHVTLTCTETIRLSDSVELIVKDQSGKVKSEYKSPPPSPRPGEPIPAAKVVFDYRLPDWPGNEDVIALCEVYLNDLETIVDEGIFKGFLTG